MLNNKTFDLCIFYSEIIYGTILSIDAQVQFWRKLNMSFAENEELIEKGVKEADKGNWLAALACFEKIVQSGGSPISHSYFAVCIARERGQFNKAEALCREAIVQEPDSTIHYLNLGKVFLVQGRKNDAILIFREGLSHGIEKRLVDELNKLGTRKKPVLPFLKRDNPLNKYLGIMLTRLSLRK